VPVYALAFSAQPGAAGPSKASVAGGPGSQPAPLPSRLAVGTYIEGYAPNSIAVVAPTGHAGRRPSEPDPDWTYGADDGGDLQMRRSPSTSSRQQQSQHYHYSSGSSASSPRAHGPPAFVELVKEPCPYPVTNIAFSPPRLASQLQGSQSTSGSPRDMVATTSECLRLFDLVQDGGPSGWRLAPRAALATSKSEYPAPLTSFSWSTVDPALIVSSSIDTTCTIWDIQQGSAITQLIAHDREVYDVSWSPASRDIFASVGADGSVRMFDIRALEHSTILYEVTGALAGSTALLRLAFNPSDENQLAIVHADSPDVFLLDVRKPSVPTAELHAHRAPVNAFSWDSHSALATAGDDCQVLVWDLSAQQQPTSPQTPASANGGARTASGTAGASSSSSNKVLRQPSLAHSTFAEVNNVVFGPGDWVGAAVGQTVRCLRV
jgi:WD repeat-containing protein 68